MTDAEREAQIRSELLTEHYFPDCHCDRCALLRLLDEARAKIARLQTPPGASAMERARMIRCADDPKQPAIGSWQVPLIARAIEQAVADERARCLHWAAGSAHTAEYVVNAIECGAPPLPAAEPTDS